MSTLPLNLDLFLSLDPHISAGMSNFQMEHFVINDHITPYRRLKQAVIEARARLETITSYGFDMEELQIKLETAKNNAEQTGNTTEQCEKRGLAEVTVRRLNFEIDRKQKLLDQLQHEAEFFMHHIRAIAETDFGGEAALVKQVQDPAFINNGEQEFWLEKLSRSVLGDMVNFGTISKGTYESILALPDALTQQVVNKGIQYHCDHIQVVRNQQQVCTDSLLVKQD